VKVTEKIQMMDFMVHLNTERHTLLFEVYPILEWTDGEKAGICYIDKQNEPDTREIFEEGKCLMKLQGSFCWRGVWEGRLYFTDSEYWGEDIEELSELYNKHIVIWCKDFIKKRNPQYAYDE
jgi:hypothetical protein